MDIGSNSVRLVVYERLARSPTPLFNEKVLAGLGTGVAENGKLATDAVEKTLGSLRRFAVLTRQMQVVETDVLATAAAREASNGAAFLKEVEAIFGVPVTVLGGPDEARISAFGVVAGILRPDGVTGDLGGGSLELTDVHGRRLGSRESLKLGSLRLQSDAKGSLKAAREIAARALQASDVLPALAGRSFYAVGGTWRSLARLHMRRTGYPLHVMHEYALDVDELAEFLKVIARGSLDSMTGIGAVSKLRRALLPYGAIVLSEILRIGKPSVVTMSALGLREGYLFEKLSPEEQRQDPLLAAAAELSILRSRSPEHGRELIPWTGEALRALGIDETAEEKRLRAAACLLADIGWRAHPEYRGEQSLSIIANAAFVGVDHPGRVYLALAVYYRHSGLSDEYLGSGIRELAPVRYSERARALAGAFRVAYLISASMPGVIARTHIRRSGKKIELILPQDLADLAAPRLETRLRHFAALTGLASAIRTG